MAPSPQDRARWAAGVLFDGAVLGALVWIRWLATPPSAPDPGLPGLDVLPDGWWRWGTACDWTLFPGADAGNWAMNVRAVLDGTPLDPYRPPVHALLVAGVTLIFGDITFAGHMVSVVLSLLVCLLTYAFGRSTSGRAAGAAAALLVALCPTLIESQREFGADTLLQCAAMLLALLTWWAAVGPTWRRIPAGLAVGLAAGAHYLSLLMAGPALLLLCLADRPPEALPPEPSPDAPRKRRHQRETERRRRLLARWGTGFGAWAIVPAVGFLTWNLLLLDSPPVGSSFLSNVLTEGVRAYSGDRGSVPDFTEAMRLLVTRLWDATGAALHAGLGSLSDLAVPWAALLGLTCLGLIGPGLRKHRDRWDGRPGLWILVFLLPTVAIEAARAPIRYSLYALPLFFLAVARGLASIGVGGDLLLKRGFSRWPRGTLALCACALGVSWAGPRLHSQWKNACSNAISLNIGLFERKVGTLVRERFGPGDCVVTRAQAIVFFSQRTTLRAGPCSRFAPEDMKGCLETLLSTCPNDAVIPYVRESFTGGSGDQPSSGLEDLVVERFDVVDVETFPGNTAWLYGMDRAVLEEVVGE